MHNSVTRYVKLYANEIFTTIKFTIVLILEELGVSLSLSKHARLNFKRQPSCRNAAALKVIFHESRKYVLRIVNVSVRVCIIS